MAPRQGFTQYGARQIVGRQAVRPPRSAAPPGGAPPGGNRNAPPPTTTTTVPTVPSPGFTPIPNGTVGSQFGGRTLDAPRFGFSPNQALVDAYGADALPQTVLDEINNATFLATPSGYTATTTGGTFTGETTAQRLAREAAARGAQTSAGFLEQQLAGAGAQYAPLLAQITGNQASLEGGVNTNYQTALAALAARVGAANTETTTNYDALRARLEAASPRAFANLPAAQAPTLSQDAVSRYAQAIGAPTGDIGQAAVEAAVPYAGTADAYNRLISNLRANEEAGQASRLAGVDMGRTSTASRIGAQNLASQNALDVQRNAALAQVLQAIQAQQLGVSQQQLAYENSLRQALAGIYGSGYATPIPRNATGEIDFSGVDFDALGRLMSGR